MDQLSQVTISPPATKGGQKIHGLNDTGTKRCGSKSSRVQLSLGLNVWVELSLGLNVRGLNVWVELSLGLNVSGLNVKAPCRTDFRKDMETAL